MSARKFDGKELCLATHNQGKVKEIGTLLQGHVDVFKSAADLNLPEPEETEDSFIGNAVLKAKAAAQESGMVALADDSGLAVAALGGAPGIYSARWAGSPRDFGKAMQRVQSELEGRDDRSAAFVCALALAWPDGHTESTEGRVHGQIVWPPRGEGGFGYDPIFLPDGHEITFGEMAPAEKEAISHRANAFRQMIDLCFSK